MRRCCVGGLLLRPRRAAPGPITALACHTLLHTRRTPPPTTTITSLTPNPLALPAGGAGNVTVVGDSANGYCVYDRRRRSLLQSDGDCK